jgi:uncharacterized protein with NAD-binding domain and iron-sulfur cluster
MSKVIVIGGGVAGMSAAHELIERGFDVEVLERNPHYVGGKARSVDVPGSNQIDSALYLPGEHGFRFFPGFYKHVMDTMQRIPLGNGKTVYDNLVSTLTVMISQKDDKPIVFPVNFPKSLKDVVKMFKGFKSFSQELADDDIEYFSSRVWRLMTSCQSRFDEEYDGISWWEFTGAGQRGQAYQRLLAGGLTRSLVACKAKTASTRTGGAIFLQLLYLMMDASSDNTDRVLNGPTNDAWLTPWMAYLRSKGVKYHSGAVVNRLQVSAGKISGVTYRMEGAQQDVEATADYYLLAVPVERAAGLVNNDMLAVDPSLRNIVRLAPNVEWMNGIQFFLNTPLNMNRGHTIYSGSNWALTSISQKQFWPGYDLSRRGNGKVVSILSVDISDWENEGDFNKKQARHCTHEEIKREVWAQLKQELNVGGKDVLRDDMLETSYLDSSIVSAHEAMGEAMLADLTLDEQDKLNKVFNLEPLLVNQINTWAIRPDAITRIPNLFLASDYVKTYTDLATMEGANEAARRAVNGILAANGSKANLCGVWKLETPWLLRVFRVADAAVFKAEKFWRGLIKSVTSSKP